MNKAKPVYPRLPGFFPTDGLSRADRLIEAHFAQQIADDPALAMRHYFELAGEEQQTPRYINTDLAREVYGPYASDKEARLVLERATVAPAGYIANVLAWNQWIVKLGPTEAQRALLFVGGAISSGKTTSVAKLFAAEKQTAAAIVDSPMTRFDRAAPLIRAALARGFEVNLVQIFRPFDLAAVGAIGRIIKEGRAVPLSMLPEAHYQAQQVFEQLRREFSGAPGFTHQLILNETNSEADIHIAPVAALEARRYSLGDESDAEHKTPRCPATGVEIDPETGLGIVERMPKVELGPRTTPKVDYAQAMVDGVGAAAASEAARAS